LACCVSKAALEIVGGDGLDGVVDGELDDDGSSGGGRCREKAGEYQEREDGFEKIPHGRL
jgi:hypothetical protein